MDASWREVVASCKSTTVHPPAHPSFDLHDFIKSSLNEDLGTLGDLTSLSTVPTETQAHATFLAKATGVIAGLSVVDLVFATVDSSLKVTWSAADGDTVTKGDKFGVVHGSAISILTGERVALNILQRMSGIATATTAMVKATQGHTARILETRKTVPGLRLLDKWAVLIGGGQNHRMGLYDMIMIKDNHIAAAGGIAAAVHGAEAYMSKRSLALPMEVEASSLGQVQEVLGLLSSEPQCMVTRIMLDNMIRIDSAGNVDVSLIQAAVKLVNGRVETEASGNVTLETVGIIAATGVSFISCGALTHSVLALDISLNIETSSPKTS